MNYSLDIFDVRGDFPLKTGRVIPYSRAIRAKEAFEAFKRSLEVEISACEFVVALSFDGSPAELACISAEGFREIVGQPSESNQFYKQQRSQLAALTIAEQRSLRTLYRLLSRAFPEREFNDATVVEEMLIGASAVNNNFSRCSNCNLPMHVESKEDHCCLRCGKENLCNYCLTSHACEG